MRLGTVIGKVVMSHRDPSLCGGRFLLVQPLTREQYAGVPPKSESKSNTVVVYDSLGADKGHIIGFIEGAEASAPFDQPTPIDAYNAALIEQIHYLPPS